MPVILEKRAVADDAPMGPEDAPPAARNQRPLPGQPAPGPLGAAETLFQSLLESAPDAIVIVDRAGQIVIANSQAAQLFGYQQRDLVGQPVEILLPERLRTTHTGHRAGYVAAPHTRPMGVGLDLVAERKDGSHFPVEISLSPLSTESGLL